MLNDIVTIILSLSREFDWSIFAQIDWFDFVLKLVISIVLVKLFRSYSKLDENMKNWSILSSLANYSRMEIVFKNKWSSSTEDFKTQELNRMIDEEMDFLRVNLQRMLKDKPLEYIDGLIAQFYPHRF
jgi:hypothetical protein